MGGALLARRIASFLGSVIVAASCLSCATDESHPALYLVDREGVVRTPQGSGLALDRMIVVRWIDPIEFNDGDPQRTCPFLAMSGFDAVAASLPFPQQWQAEIRKAGLAILEIDEAPALARTIDLVTPWNEAERDRILSSDADRPAWIEARVLPLPSMKPLDTALKSTEDPTVRLAFRDRETVERLVRQNRVAAWRTLVQHARGMRRGTLVVAGPLDRSIAESGDRSDSIASNFQPPRRSIPAVRVLGSSVERNAVRSLGIRIQDDTDLVAARVVLCGDLTPCGRDRAEFERVVRSLHRVANEGGLIVFLEPPDREHPLVRFGLLPEFDTVQVEHSIHAATPVGAAGLGLPTHEPAVIAPAFVECLPRELFQVGPSSIELVVSLDSQGEKLGCALFSARVGQGAVIHSSFRLLESIDRHVAPRFLLSRIVELADTTVPRAENSSPGSIASLTSNTGSWSVEAVLERFDRERALRRAR